MKHPASFDFWDKAVDVIGYVVTAACIIWVAGILGYQVVMWLKYGGWVPLPTSVVFEFFDVSLERVYSPSSWHGLAKVGQWLLALPVSMTVPGLMLIAYSTLYGAIREN